MKKTIITLQVRTFLRLPVEKYKSEETVEILMFSDIKQIVTGICVCASQLGIWDSEALASTLFIYGARLNRCCIGLEYVRFIYQYLAAFMCNLNAF
jgi:hypothetical protein